MKTLLAPLLLAAALPALASGHERLRTPLNATYTQECAACHLAYPPGLLPADSWRRVMGRLATHYGADASLEPAVAVALSTWLAANAGTGRKVAAPPPEDRITRSAWFQRKHDEIAPAVWRRPSVKSAAQCSACHRDAAAGDFDEHRVEIPR